MEILPSAQLNQELRTLHSALLSLQATGAVGEVEEDVESFKRMDESIDLEVLIQLPADVG